MSANLSFTFLIAGLFFWGCSSSPGNNQIFEKLSYHQPEGFSDSILVGTYEVFENLDDRMGRKIPLHVVVTPALIRDSLQEPIFIIDGGPGIGATHQSYFYTEIDHNYRRYRDIVFVDVRGTGKSQPLNCTELQTKASPIEHFGNPFPIEELKACIDRYRDSVDFNFYKTKYIVDDIDNVRKWLGYGKINLLGISFGGKVSLLYLNKYPHFTNKVVLHAPDAPVLESLSHRGRYAQRSLDILFEYCSRDSLCNLHYPKITNEFNELMGRIKSGGVHTGIAFNDSTYNIELSWPPIAGKIAAMLYEDVSYVQLPFIIHEAFKGNYEPLLQAFNFRDTTTNYFFADGMFLSNICAEDILEATKNYEPEEKNSFLGDYTFQTRKLACDIWPVNPVEEFISITSEIPTLIISGGMDPALPPETGAQIASGLTNSTHIVIPYMGHMFTGLSNPECYDNYVLSFFEGKEDRLELSCFQEMKPNPFKLPTSSD